MSATLTPDPVEELDLLPPEASFDPGNLSTSRPWTPLGPQRGCSVPPGELGNLQGRSFLQSHCLQNPAFSSETGQENRHIIMLP